MSRLLIWSPNYAPELTGIPPLVTDAAEWLAAQGHGVRVVTAFPNYPSRRILPTYRGAIWRSERVNGIRVERSWLRVRPNEGVIDKALYELSFSTVSLPLAARAAAAADVVVCVLPTVLAAAYARVLCQGLRRRLVLWVQDLVLEGAAALDPSPVARRALAAARRIERFAARGADRIVVCSPGFHDYLVRLECPPERIETIYNWADTNSIDPRRANGQGEGPIRFLYAGNVGYSQGLETLVAAADLAGPGISVRIVGDGNGAEAVRGAAARVGSISVEPPVPREEYAALLADSDVNVVIQRRVSAGANLPSKIATGLASGRPILASIEKTTPAARLLEESGAAVFVEPESPSELAQAMQALAADAALREELGVRGRKFAEERLSKEGALAALERAIVG